MQMSANFDQVRIVEQVQNILLRVLFMRIGGIRIILFIRISPIRM